jgi:acyl-CoA reductase-like NAD-dependent aldehyde dehydrogenase
VWRDQRFFAPARRVLVRAARVLPVAERGEWLDAEAQRLAEDLAELAAERADELGRELAAQARARWSEAA